MGTMGTMRTMTTSARTTEQRLRERRDKIINAWDTRVRAEIGASHGEEKLELRNSLMAVLDALALALAASDPESALAAQQQRFAVEHGRIRARNPAYALQQVIDEYHVLRTVIFEVIEEGGFAIPSRDRDVIWDAIFASIRNAATVFTKERDEDRQRETDRQSVELKTALSEMEAETELKDQLLRTIFERVEDYAIFSLDSEGKITSWAKGCVRMKGYERSEVIGHHFEMLYPEDGRLRGEPNAHLDVARQEGRFRGEGLRRRKSGEHFLADVFIAPMYDGEELVGFFKVVSDLTERNRVIQERDLTRARAETLQLESDLRDRFVFTLTHDLRNPLSAARTCAELIARQPCELVRHTELAHRALQTVDRIDHMVTDLLDASRIRSGQGIPLTLEDYDVVEQLHDVKQDQATVHGDRIVMQLPDTCVVHWDRHAMRRVFDNLVTNAIKYGDAASPVTIKVACVEDRVLLKVHNRGSTISPADQESLFELFHRTAAAERGSKRGWGLGLTLVRGITEAHGGVVTLQSLPDSGTTFMLDLPSRVEMLKA
jgi:PAS domain S-box-containing protein